MDRVKRNNTVLLLSRKHLSTESLNESDYNSNQMKILKLYYDDVEILIEHLEIPFDDLLKKILKN